MPVTYTGRCPSMLPQLRSLVGPMRKRMAAIRWRSRSIFRCVASSANAVFPQALYHLQAKQRALRG